MTGKNKELKSNERWIRGYEGLYYVCDLGGVYSCYNRVKGLIALKQTQHKSGYLVVTLSKDKKQKVYKVHQLIANAFIKEEKHHECINHIDGDKTNNVLANLERCTFSQNRQHAIDNKLQVAPIGENHYNSKLTKQNVIDIKRELSLGRTCESLATEFNVTRKNISAIKNGKSWKHI